jgi:hypothetical protein
MPEPGNVRQFVGLSTDTRPESTDEMPIGTGSIYTEIDGTKRDFLFVEGNINPATSDSWWEV